MSEIRGDRDGAVLEFLRAHVPDAGDVGALEFELIGACLGLFRCGTGEFDVGSPRGSAPGGLESRSLFVILVIRMFQHVDSAEVCP